MTGAPARRQGGSGAALARSFRAAGPAAVGLLIFLTLWALAARRWPAHVLPGPTVVFGTLWETRAVVAENALRTARRVLAGYVAAVAVGLPLAWTMGAVPWVDRQVGAVIGLLRAIPPFAWVPLLLLWLGIGDTGAALVVFAGAFFPVVRYARAGVASVPPTLVLAARNLGAGGPRLVATVLAPGALPLTITGLRLGWTLAWMSVVAAELVGADGGLGQMVLDARNLARPDVAMAGMVAIGAMAAASEGLLGLVAARVLRWRA
jgi:ABC-type nitrate/sulfonate/bicarbonate transport system permease component